MGCVFSWGCCRDRFRSCSKCCFPVQCSCFGLNRLNCCCKHRRDSGSLNPRPVPVFTERSLDSVSIPSHNFRLEYSVLTQRGYYPDSPDKDNQDSFCIKTGLNGSPNVHFFGVFDGHGQFGTECSNFVKDRLVELLSKDPLLVDDPVKAYENAFLATNEELHNSEIDDSMSGTTAITVLVIGDTLYVANVGDSRAVTGIKEGNQVVAKDLSTDQTPFRKDEYERVKLCGARVLSVDQVEGLKDPSVQTWGDEETEGNDPPRLWVQNGMYPGTAFTRSVGDCTAEMIGVVAVPEVKVVQLTPEHQFLVVASDGVFEFLSSQKVIDMVARHQDPRDACSFIAGESYKQWLEHENRTDDITIIVAHIKGLNTTGSGGGATNSPPTADAKQPTIESAVATPSEASISEQFRSVGSSFSEMQPCRPLVPMDRNAAVVAPTPALNTPT